jgi:hypothetical protein
MILLLSPECHIGRSTCDVHPDLVILDPDGKDAELFALRVDALACRHVELPTVRTTRELATLKLTLSERLSLMRADSLDRSYDTTGKVHQEDVSAFDLEGRHVTLPQVIERADPLERHRS